MIYPISCVLWKIKLYQFFYFNQLQQEVYPIYSIEPQKAEAEMYMLQRLKAQLER